MGFKNEMKEVSKGAYTEKKDLKKGPLPGNYSYQMSDTVVEECITFVKNEFKKIIERLEFTEDSSLLLGLPSHAYIMRLILRISLSQDPTIKEVSCDAKHHECTISLSFQNPDNIKPIVSKLADRLFKEICNYIHVDNTRESITGNRVTMAAGEIPGDAIKLLKKQQSNGGAPSVTYSMSLKVKCNRHGVVK